MPSQPVPTVNVDWPSKDEYVARSRFDWRVLVGGLGRTFISVGCLLFLFVGYLLWGTSIQTARYQDSLRKQFDERNIVVATTTTTVALPASNPVSTVGSSVATTPSTTPPPPTTTTLAPLPVPENGDVLGLMDIPKIGVKEKAIVSGVTVDDLKKGPGHFRNTVQPGEVGNAAIAGHRTTYGQPFNRIDELEPGDEIIFTDRNARRFVYRVTEQLIVAPSDVSVLLPTPTSTLTLVSCHPKLSAVNRIIIKAVYDQPASGVAPLPPAPIVETTLPEPGPSDPASQDPLDEPVITETGDVEGGAFEQGWFGDPKAWPHIAMWGMACGVVALLAFGLSQWTNRNWVGALVGFAPFLVVLYFFFENANRLLPPNL